MTKEDIKVPNIGEFKNVEVIEVLIKKDQVVKKNDPLITIESDKSSVEIPSTHDGKVLSLNVKLGDKVSEGDKILDLEIIDTIETEREISNFKDEKEQKIKAKTQSPENNYKRSNLIVKDFTSKTLASPKARKFARELGVNVNKVLGCEREGRVTEKDIKLFVSNGRI